MRNSVRFWVGANKLGVYGDNRTVSLEGQVVDCGVREAVATERAQVEKLYRQYGGLIASWSARLGGPRMDVDDLVQEVFLVIADRLKGFRGNAKITTWLFRITRNVVRNRRRRERHLRWVARFSGSMARNLMTAPATPIESLERSEVKARVYRALDGLSERHRDTLILAELEGLRGEEIAELMGVPVGAIWTRLSRARQEFIQRFSELEAQP